MNRDGLALLLVTNKDKKILDIDFYSDNWNSRFVPTIYVWESNRILPPPVLLFFHLNLTRVVQGL